jgi:hypothetical protein
MTLTDSILALQASLADALAKVRTPNAVPRPCRWHWLPPPSLHPHPFSSLHPRSAPPLTAMQGRMEMSFSRLQKSYTGASIEYVPREVIPTARILLGASSESAPSSSSASASSIEASPAPPTLVRRAPGPSAPQRVASNAGEEPASRTGAGDKEPLLPSTAASSSPSTSASTSSRGGAAGSVAPMNAKLAKPDDPLSWFGDNPSPSVYKAAGSFSLALDLCLRLVAARGALARKADGFAVDARVL